jgi:hypothetical protein
MDQLQTRLDALEQHVQTLNQRTHTVKRQLHWWRGLACGAVVLAVLTWALPAGTGQQEPPDGGGKGLAQRVAALEQLLKPFSREKNEIFITGANLHLVNGLGRTDCGSEDEPIADCPNGLGNLIVGYNASRGPEDNRTGSHNVVVGQGHNFSRFGGLVVGAFNEISGDFAVVSGGATNTASGVNSSVSGESFNTASGDLSSVSGGNSNTASNFSSTVSGGGGNTAGGELSTVSGGGFNAFSEEPEGAGNTAGGELSTVSGGAGNTANGQVSSVSGGQNLTQDTDFGWAAGSEAEAVVEGNVRSP